MFGRVVFLLYLPAICLTFALFPNNGHVAQRRQNPEENMVNMTFGQDELSCLMMYYPCMNTLFENVALELPKDFVVDGNLAVQCELTRGKCLSKVKPPGGEPELLNAASQCDGDDDDDFYKTMLLFQRIWDFVCKHSEAFVAGEGCWRSPELDSATNGCNGPLSGVCVSTCVREATANMTDCSTDDSILLGRLVEIMMEETEGSC